MITPLLLTLLINSGQYFDARPYKVGYIQTFVVDPEIRQERNLKRRERGRF